MSVKTKIAQSIPPKWTHAYRVIRYTKLFPFEPELSAVPKLTDRNSYSLDIGANMGVYAHVIAQSSKRVVAFEPHPRCVSHLKSINMPKVDLVDAAASDTDGKTILRVPLFGAASEPGLSTISENNTFVTANSTGVEKFEVDTVQVDTALRRRNLLDEPIAFAKIDVEGHEFAVLKGMTATLQRARPSLLIELESRHGGSTAEVFAFLKTHDYRGYRWASGRTVPIDNNDLARLQKVGRFNGSANDDENYVFNVIFLPEERARVQ